jgi:hypothetical protein
MFAGVIDAGERVYVVCPRIDMDEDADDADDAPARMGSKLSMMVWAMNVRRMPRVGRLQRRQRSRRQPSDRVARRARVAQNHMAEPKPPVACGRRNSATIAIAASI